MKMYRKLLLGRQPHLLLLVIGALLLLGGNANVATASTANAETCQTGYYDNGSGCVAADPGYYVDVVGATEQIPCAPGFYQPESGQDSCLAAPAGTFVDIQAAVAASPCSPGTYQPVAGQSSCLVAPPGTFVDFSGATEATRCPSGTYQPAEGQIACLATPPGTFVATVGAASATPCEPGFYQPAEGQIECLAADPGFYVAIAGAVAQTACPSGYTSEAAAIECVLLNLNHPPSADAGGPYVVAVGAQVTLDSSASTDPDGDVLSITWSATEGTISGNIYTAGNTAGIFDATVTVADPGSLEATASSMIVVYDPTGGFVTGGGWVWSEPGSCQLDALCTGAQGKANFGFVSKYKKGADVPTGNTQFNFEAGALNFHSDTYEWLVVTGSNDARYKGAGTINGASAPNDTLYKFQIWAADGSPDTFRIRIWWEGAGGAEHDVYDNGFEQAIGGGSIVVHEAKQI